MGKIKVKETRKAIGIRFDVELLDLLERISKQPGTIWTGQSRTALIEYAIRNTYAFHVND